MNAILNKVIENRKGHYVHAIEVRDTYEIENVIEAITDEFSEYGTQALKEFFNTMTVYYIGDDEETETEVHNFDIEEYIDDNILI